MGEHAHIHSGGYVSIDVDAWIEQRTAGPVPELTTALNRWTDDVLRLAEPSTDPPPLPHRRLRAAQTWCQQMEYRFPEPDLISHVGTRLESDLWILRAGTTRHGPIAVIGIDDRPAVVYSDYCSDSWDWFDADSITITCPHGHGWTWRTGRELIDSSGSFTTLTVVFGPDLDAPFSPCPRCTSSANDPAGQPCGCGGRPWILCPTCEGRCDVELPTV